MKVRTLRKRYQRTVVSLWSKSYKRRMGFPRTRNGGHTGVLSSGLYYPIFHCSLKEAFGV